MNNHPVRLILLLADALALVGVVAFSVLAALYPDDTRYLVGQIACIVMVLVSGLLLTRWTDQAGR